MAFPTRHVNALPWQAHPWCHRRDGWPGQSDFFELGFPRTWAPTIDHFRNDCLAISQVFRNVNTVNYIYVWITFRKRKALCSSNFARKIACIQRRWPSQLGKPIWGPPSFSKFSSSLPSKTCQCWYCWTYIVPDLCRRNAGYFPSPHRFRSGDQSPNTPYPA